MPKTLASSFLIFALLVIAVLSWQWLDDDAVTTSSSENPIQMAQNQTDYYLENFKITNINNDKGQIYELSGNSLSHFIEKGNSAIEYPVMQVFSNDDDYWTGKAQRGNLSADLSVLELSNNVDLAHHRHDSPPLVSVQTQSLTIDTKKRQMTSDQPVQFSSENWSFNANQMRADVDNGMVFFNSGVEANYAVEQ